jgi:hypothetical protein
MQLCLCLRGVGDRLDWTCTFFIEPGCQVVRIEIAVGWFALSLAIGLVICSLLSLILGDE